MEYYYSAQPFLSWVINTYFYNRRHYLYVAPFYPYRLPNPHSSNPYEVFASLYKPWKDMDDYDPVLSQKRLNIRKGVMAKEKATDLSTADSTILKDVCDKVSINFFCPILYRVNIESIAPDRRVTSGSGLSGSKEYLIQDLYDNEFDILFFDYEDEILKQLFDKRNQSKEKVLTILQNNYATAK